MTTVQTLNDSKKMKRHIISDKPCLPSFAKAKEKQRHPQANANCFTFAFAPPHSATQKDNFIITINQNKKYYF